MHASPDRWRLIPSNRRILAALLLVACVAMATDALGCPTCKDAVNTADPEGLNVARGYFYSILLMLAMPFTLAGSFGLYVWREMRRQKLAAAESVVEPTRTADLPALPPTAAVP
jgi:hypothetical protein